MIIPLISPLLACLTGSTKVLEEDGLLYLATANQTLAGFIS
jgi:hypothetical protein